MSKNPAAKPKSVAMLIEMLALDATVKMISLH
jgi:hypothetical protein